MYAFGLSESLVVIGCLLAALFSPVALRLCQKKTFFLAFGAKKWSWVDL
jgi:hypothetical protein